MKHRIKLAPNHYIGPLMGAIYDLDAHIQNTDAIDSDPEGWDESFYAYIDNLIVQWRK